MKVLKTLHSAGGAGTDVPSLCAAHVVHRALVRVVLVQLLDLGLVETDGAGRWWAAGRGECSIAGLFRAEQWMAWQQGKIWLTSERAQADIAAELDLLDQGDGVSTEELLRVLGPTARVG